jgi:hypothetical protein
MEEAPLSNGVPIVPLPALVYQLRRWQRVKEIAAREE